MFEFREEELDISQNIKTERKTQQRLSASNKNKEIRRYVYEMNVYSKARSKS